MTTFTQRGEIAGPAGPLSVAVDTTTYTPTVTEFHALQEVGKVLHPVLAAGQIEGGVAQAIGFALYEKCRCSRRRRGR